MAFLTATLLAPPAPDALPPLPRMTASALYEGCVRYVASASATSRSGAGDAEISCAVNVAVVQAIAAADAAGDRVTGGGRRSYCLPEAMLDSDGTPIARAFIAFLDRHPELRTRDSEEVFEQAMADKGPCPR